MRLAELLIAIYDFSAINSLIGRCDTRGEREGLVNPHRHGLWVFLDGCRAR